MRYLSLFSGIEAATVAWHPLGWECVGVAEIEPFPCAVLAHHYPDVPNLGSVTEITEAQIKALGPIDLVVFGSPCQDLSVAGHRKGLIDESGNATRSGLFFDAVNILHWAVRNCGCRWGLWENVPGTFSSNKGRDFAAVVEWLAGLDTVDVPPKGWGPEGVAVGEEAMVEWATLDAQWFGVAQRRRRVFALADFGDWANRPPVLLERDSLRGDSAPSRGAGEEVAGSAADCVDCGQPYPVANCLTRRMHKGINSTLDEDQTPVVAFHPTQDPISSTDGSTHAMGCGSKGGAATVAVATVMQVRRLTPIECERLQGFPDNYTNIPWRGKPTSPDGPRYKALGNSMAVPVMRWIGIGLDIVH